MRRGWQVETKVERMGGRGFWERGGGGFSLKNGEGRR